MERLYQFIESYLPDDYKVTYQTLDETQENNIGIFLYQGQADDNWNDGLASEYIKVHIEMNCGKSADTIIQGMNDLRRSVINLEDAVDDIDGLDIQFIKILNKAIPIGKNEHGIQKVVSNIEIKFTMEVD